MTIFGKIDFLIRNAHLYFATLQYVLNIRRVCNRIPEAQNLIWTFRLLGQVLSFIFYWIKKSQNIHPCLGSVKIPMWICFLMLLCYITTGATVFCVYQEKWSFVDAFFFAFSVLWTIGLQAENTDQQQTDGLFVIICTLYLLIGTVYILGQ